MRQLGRGSVARVVLERKRRARMAAVIGLSVWHPLWAAQFSQANPADGKSAMMMTGDIVTGDANKFIHYIKENFVNKHRSLTALYLDSDGGVLEDGGRIAEVVHRIDLAVVVGDSAVCQSACFLILAASKQRVIGARARLGVHSTAADPELVGGKTAEDSSAMAETVRLARLYRHYGVPDSVVVGMVSTLPSSIYTLSETEKRLLRAGQLR